MGRGGLRTRWVGLCLGGVLAGCGGLSQTAPSQTASTGDERSTPPSDETGTSAPPVSAMPPNPAPVRWQALSFGPSPVSVTTDASGNVYTLSLESLPVSPSADVPLVLTQADATGHELWHKSLSAPGSPVQLNAQSIVVSPQGDLFLAYQVKCGVPYWPCRPARYSLASEGTSAATGAVLVKLSSTGEVDWVSAQEASTPLGLVVNRSGTAILLAQKDLTSEARVSWYESDGTRLRQRVLSSATAIGLDPSDNILLGGTGPTLRKWTPEGQELWVRGAEGASQGDNPVTRVGTSALGTVVATGPFRGTYDWGASRLEGSAEDNRGVFLLVTEADGQPRWGVTASVEADATLALAVDPSGQVVLATSPPDGGRQASLDKYNLAGAHVWHRELGTSEHCVDPRANITLTSLAIAPDHAVLVGGWHQGLALLGARCVTGSAGFLQVLDP